MDTLPSPGQQKAPRLFVTCDIPPVLGGQASYFANLWSGEASAHDLLLVPDQCREYCSTQFQARTYAVEFASGEGWLSRFTRLFQVIWYTVRLSLRHRPAAIHAGQLLAGGIAARISAGILRIPFVLYIFGADLLEFQKSAVGRFLIRQIVNGASQVIACSHFTATAVRQAVPGVKSIAVVNPGVDTRFFVDKDESAREVRSRLGLHNNLVMLSIGRLVERKGHDVALRAFARVLEDHPDLRYVVAGDGPERDRLGRIAAQEGIEPYVVFCGSLPDTALPAYYAMADFFIMVSRHLVDRGDVEGFGIVYLEANAAGLPVIAGRSGGSSDAVEHGVNGLLIDDPLSVEEIARAISSFCDDTEGRQRLGRQGKERARRFAWTHQQRLWRRSLEAMV